MRAHYEALVPLVKLSHSVIHSTQQYVSAGEYRVIGIYRNRKHLTEWNSFFYLNKQHSPLDHLNDASTSRCKYELRMIQSKMQAIKSTKILKFEI